MHYKTITLELLQQYPTLHHKLQSSGKLLQALNQCATTLRDLHRSWMETLAQERPGRDPSQISSEALELALQELRDSLPAESTPNAAAPEETLSLDAAMACIRRHTPPAS